MTNDFTDYDPHEHNATVLDAYEYAPPGGHPSAAARRGAGQPQAPGGGGMSERKYLLHRDAGYIVSLERQAAKQYRREQGGMSGRQFRKARKAGSGPRVRRPTGGRPEADRRRTDAALLRVDGRSRRQMGALDLDTARTTSRVPWRSGPTSWRAGSSHVRTIRAARP
jgi:hypothetical protein